MGLFHRRPAFCFVCNTKLTHRHKPKKEWGISGLVCGNCYFDKAREYYEGKTKQQCALCSTTRKVTDLWEPRWQWDMEGLLCKQCFDRKEQTHDKRKTFCALCGATMGFIRYNPKSKWNIEGQLCRQCWDSKKADLG